MKKLILVRHGLTDWNENGRLMGRADVEINTRGRTQAERVAHALAPRAIVTHYPFEWSSIERRDAQTHRSTTR